MRFVIITGLSGAGKTQAVHCFEDMGYYCVDNLPPALLVKFVQLCMQSVAGFPNVAAVIDIRGGGMFGELLGELDRISESGFKYEILFLDADDKTLVGRYKESRRAHPLAAEGNVLESIARERLLLSDIKRRADYVLGTTGITPGELREKIVSAFSFSTRADGLIINIISFGFKYGIPLDSDLVFDVRFLPNPYYIEALRPKNGLDDEVSQYIKSFPETGEFFKKLIDMLRFLIPHYIGEGKSQLVISIGCTGGKHRSVMLCEALSAELKKDMHRVFVSHRDIDNE